MYCNHNQLTKLSHLPNTLTGLGCRHNQLTKLSHLPNTLTGLDCCHNQLTKLSNLQNTLTFIAYGNNQLIFTHYSDFIKLDKFITFFNLNKLLKVIFIYAVKQRCSKYKEELIIKTCHPSRLFLI